LLRLLSQRVVRANGGELNAHFREAEAYGGSDALWSRFVRPTVIAT
jgi:hypothetical protein